MSASEHGDTQATHSTRKKILLTCASRLLGEDVAAIHRAPPIEQQWLLTRAGLLLCASGLSATGYYLFIGMSFSQIPAWAPFLGAFGVWLFIIFLDRAVSAIRHGGSGSMKTAAVCVRLVIAIALTSATSLAFTVYFAHEKLDERIHVEYLARIAPLVAQRDAALKSLQEAIDLKRSDFSKAMELRSNAAAMVDSIGKQRNEQQALADKANDDMRQEVRTGIGPRYMNAWGRQTQASNTITKLENEQAQHQNTDVALKKEMEERRLAVQQAEEALTTKKAEIDYAMHHDPAWSENRHDPVMVVYALLGLLAEPHLGGATWRILATFGAVILILEMSFVVLSIIAPAGQYDASVRYGRGNKSIMDESDSVDLVPERSQVVTYAPSWKHSGQSG